MDLPLVLAGAHHLLAFPVAGLLAAELALLRPGMDAGTLRRLGRIDAAYGAAFGLLLAVGIARLVWGESGWRWYVENPLFWAKMALLGAITALSLPPTVRFIRWRRTGIPAGGPAATRPWLWAEAGLLALVPLVAAAVARGYGA